MVYAQCAVDDFKDLDDTLCELANVMKPVGTIVKVDPMMTEPPNRFVRTLYRPFQANAAWDWPFKRRTLRTVERSLEIDEMKGFSAWRALAFP